MVQSSTPGRKQTGLLMLVWGAMQIFGCMPALHAANSAEDDSVEFVASSGFGYFEAEVSGDELLITHRVYFEFLDGNVELAPGFAPEEYVWDGNTPTKIQFKAEYKRQIEEIWSNRYLISDGDEMLSVRVRVEIVEKPSDAHYFVEASHYPEDVWDLGADVTDCNDASNYGECETSDQPQAHGVIRLNVTQIRPQNASDPEIGEHWVYFKEGTAQFEENSRALDEISIVWLLMDVASPWHAQLTGYASLDEVSGYPSVEGGGPSIALARVRTDALLEALVELEVSEDRIHVVNVGAQGGPSHSGSPRNVVAIQLSRGQPQSTFAHEVGHAFGLGDEYTDETCGAGAPVVASAYAAMIAYWRPNDDIITCGKEDSIMGSEMRVHPRHYVPFVEAMWHLRDSEDWKIVEP